MLHGQKLDFELYFGQAIFDVRKDHYINTHKNTIRCIIKLRQINNIITVQFHVNTSLHAHKNILFTEFRMA